MAVRNLLKLTSMVARDILKILLTGKTMSPMQMALALPGVAPQSARNAVVTLNALSLIERVRFGHYKITDFGREVLAQIEAQPSTDQSCGGTKQ